MPRIKPIDCPICDHPNLKDLSKHFKRSHGIDGQERKQWLRKAKVLSLSGEKKATQHSSSTFCEEQRITTSSFPSPLPETCPQVPCPPQPNQHQCVANEIEEDDEALIPCPYDNRISYEKCMGQNVPILDYDVFKLRHPFSMLVSGPRGAGKSEFVKRLLIFKNIVMSNAPERIVWFYGRYQPELFEAICKEVPIIEFHEGLPSNVETIFDRSKRNLCILDDLMRCASSNQTVEDLFTNGRHLNLSVVFISQNLFYKGKNSRTISLNSTYIVVFKNPRDQSQIRQLACQMYPGRGKILQAAYEVETKEPYRYLFLDLHPESPEFARMRGNIFPYDLLNDPCWLYMPKDMEI